MWGPVVQLVFKGPGVRAAGHAERASGARSQGRAWDEVELVPVVMLLLPGESALHLAAPGPAEHGLHSGSEVPAPSDRRNGLLDPRPGPGKEARPHKG